MFRSARNCPCSFFSDLLFDLIGAAAGVDRGRQGRKGNDSVFGKCRGLNQFLFAAVPLCEDFRAGCAAKDSGVDQASKLDARYVTRGAVNAFEVPDGFCATGTV